MTLQIIFRSPLAGPQWRRQMELKVRRIARASSLGTEFAAKEIEREGRIKISQAGNFGQRWQRGLHADRFPKSGYVINNRIDVYHTHVGATVHEFGATIQGRPLLWLPLSFANLKMRAAEYGKRYGLFYVARGGGKKPLLLSKHDHKPKYVGVQSVRIPARWGIRAVCRKVMANFATYYNRNLIQRP